MRIRFAIWESGPAAYFDHCHLPELEEHGVGIKGGLRLMFLIGEDCVDLYPREDATSHLLVSTDPVNLPFMVRSNHLEYAARCSLMPLDLNWHDDHWHADLPLPHLLPWPNYHEHDKFVFDKREAVVREIRIRVDSAERHTGSRAIRVDKKAQELLTPRERVRLFTEWRV